MDIQAKIVIYFNVYVFMTLYRTMVSILKLMEFFCIYYPGENQNFYCDPLFIVCLI